MSFLPPDLLVPGQTAVVGSLTAAGPTQPFFAPASGGGGGGGGPNLVVSTLTTSGQSGANITLNGGQLSFDSGGEFGPYITWVDDITTLVQTVPAGGAINIGTSESGANSLNITDFTVGVSSLTVSSINGQAPGGGGGGGGGPNPSFSSISMTTYNGQSDNGKIFWPEGTSTLSIQQNPVFAPALGVPSLNSVFTEGNSIVSIGGGFTAGKIGVLGIGGQYNTQIPGVIDGNGQGSVVISSLNVSSINGASPGGGASLFTSSFSLACPGQASTLVMEMPAGQYAYQGEALFTGAKAFLSGRLSAIYNVTATQWSANFMADDKGANDPADTQPNIEMTINYGRNALSTVQLLVANNNTAGSGDCTWVGAVGKLY